MTEDEARYMVQHWEVDLSYELLAEATTEEDKKAAQELMDEAKQKELVLYRIMCDNSSLAKTLAQAKESMKKAQELIKKYGGTDD